MQSLAELNRMSGSSANCEFEGSQIMHLQRMSVLVKLRRSA